MNMYRQIVAPIKKKSRVSVATREWRSRVVEVEKRTVSAPNRKSAPYEDFKSEDEMNEFISKFAKKYFDD